MTPTPNSTSSSSAISPEDQFRVVRKRNRVPLSCYPCRSKNKCDRGHPCSNCVRRDGANTLSCSYAAPTSRKKSQAPGSASPDDMQNRIDRLENLVLSLMHNGGNSDNTTTATATEILPSRGATSRTESIVSSGGEARSGPRNDIDASGDGGGGGSGDGDDDENESDVDDGLATSLGVLKVDTSHGKAMYLGQEDWHIVLADLAEVKNYFVQHKKDLEKSYQRVRMSKSALSREAPTFLQGAPAISEADLRAELPPRSQILTLCSRYFNSMDNAVNIIHAPTFNAQLRNLWKDPSQVSLMWIGLLYSVLCLAMLSYHKVGDEPPEWKGRSMELASLYRVRTVQCLVTADYTKPVEYTVETMILYVFGEYSSRWEAEIGLWLIVALITRVAFRMGYHRDPKWFPSITPFQGEMRRRTWAFVRMSDVMFSHRVSLPNMIYDHDCDTQLPLNIFDEEFGPDTKVMPPPRPATEATPINYMIAKVKLSLELGKILQATTRVGKPVPYDEILRFDAELRELKANLPPHLQMQPLEKSRDPLSLIIARFNVDILHSNIVCLLHRKYLPRARQNPRYAPSRRRAIEASMENLRHLQTLHRESQPTGRLRNIKWFVSSIATRDFLLPAMIVALELRYCRISCPKTSAGNLSQADSPTQAPFWAPEQLDDMMSTLVSIKEIWQPVTDASMDAYKAYNILRIVLEKITSPDAHDATTMAAEPSKPDTVWASCSDGALSPGSNPVDADGNNNAATGFLPVATDSHDSTQPALQNGASTIAPLNLMSDVTPGLPASLYGGLVPGAGTTAYAGNMTPPLATSAAMNTAAVTTPPEFQADFFNSMAGFDFGGNYAANNILDENSMDFTSNFDWDTLQNFAQSGPFAASQPFQLFSEPGGRLPTGTSAELGQNDIGIAGNDDLTFTDTSFPDMNVSPKVGPK